MRMSDKFEKVKCKKKKGQGRGQKNTCKKGQKISEEWREPQRRGTKREREGERGS